jgi:putative ABC transport system permease protein
LDKDGGRAGAADGSMVPIIGDYTTIVWIFEKGLGGTIRVTDESGHAVELRIVAILHDSIFQGSVFLSEPAMKRLYPTQSQYNMFLFRAAGNGTEGSKRVETVAAGLEGSLASYGFRARPVDELAAGFIKVDMAYVSMLQAMLAAGILIGTLGFAAKAARETIERRFELGVMRAIGVPRGRLERLALGENMFIFLLGFGIALGAAAAASAIFLGGLPSLADTLVLFGLLFWVVALSTIWPVRRFNAHPVAAWLKIPE